jgi:hypothetical protein
MGVRALLYIRKGLCFHNSQSGTLGTFFGGLGSNIVVCFDPFIIPYGRTTEMKQVERKFRNHGHPMIRTLFPNNDTIFRDDTKMPPYNCSVMV